ncbi:MAG: hypothetical protein Q9174_004441 [Haloplaca sp. 1 TL-2023]
MTSMRKWGHVSEAEAYTREQKRAKFTNVMDEKDVHNYSSSPHRLPTVSASQALQDIESSSQKPISTGLRRLDEILQGNVPETIVSEDSVCGVSRGQVTEIYGSPGAGKTIFAYFISIPTMIWGDLADLRAAGQTSLPMLYAREAQSYGLVSRLWLWHGSYSLNAHRLKDLLTQVRPVEQDGMTSGNSVVESLSRFHHFVVPTLSHLLALLLHPTAAFLPKDVSLLVVDSISTPFQQAFVQAERQIDVKNAGKKTDTVQWAAGRRWAVMGELITALGKLAATRNMAVVLTSQTTTRLRLDSSALLHPAISGMSWEAGISSRILLYRDWHEKSEEVITQERIGLVSDLRWATVTKVCGRSMDGFGDGVPFTICDHGLDERIVSSQAMNVHEPAVLPQAPLLKRKREGDEIADSDSDSGGIISDDEFDWVEENTLTDQ